MLNIFHHICKILILIFFIKFISNIYIMLLNKQNFNKVTLHIKFLMLTNENYYMKNNIN